MGKTSVARSIARALGRKFVRISLGGIKDEAEIRGHRRTYVGALPGKIIQQIRRAGTQNPVFLLDEIDKMGKDFRGDPQAALMEVLDPEINKTFQDHYLEVDFDLSKVLFITTANNIYNIPKPLLDRMEVIEFSSYLEWEKIEIAKRHLIPKNKKLLGIPDEKVEIKDDALKKIISEYTKEAGVRELERVIAKILRKSAKKIVEGVEKVIVDENNLKDFLGVPKYKQIKVSNVLPTGCAYGLAWTEYGGEILRIESVVMPGEGKIQLTGHLGEIIKESALAGFSYIRKECEKFGLSPDFYKTIDLHLHIPEGAIPKDGPSAGIPIFLSILSSLTSKSIPADIASTGEITLSGDILPVGGLKEKIMAAKRNKIKRVIVPSENKSEIEELPKEVKEDIEILFVAKIEDVLKIVFPDFGKKGEESFFISQWAKTS
ncbi:endopeptidase La [Candidatus Pacearchaeota archaeon]|nr:MAG: endopeptidase La [Candidatus Pacearchaeota archaeon]